MMIGYTLWGLVIAYTFYCAAGMAVGSRPIDTKIRSRNEQVSIGIISGIIQLVLLLLVFNGV